MNFDVFILGTSGMMPLPNRFLTSAMVRRNGELFLFDCGEGNQISLKMLNLHWKRISSIFISHMHADHVTGLPGLLMLTSQVDRTEPLHIYGTKKLKEYIEFNRKILEMYINYEIIIHIISPGIILETDEYKVSAIPLLHSKPCFGFIFEEKTRPGIFYPQKALSLGVPVGEKFGKLQRGESIKLENGNIVNPKDVMGEPRVGRKFSYITDSIYLSYISEYVRNSDLLICEGMFCNDLAADAAEKKHMTSTQAAFIARDGNVKKLALIHYSPRYTEKELQKLKDEAKLIFPNTILSKDRMVFNIPLKD